MNRWLLAITSLLGAVNMNDAEEKPLLNIRYIMVQAHLTPQNRGTLNNLDNKVLDGKATEAEKKQLLELYQQLAKAKPPKGDLAMWKQRTTTLVDATTDLIRDKDKGTERFLKARDCKSCHAAHRISE